MEPQAMKNVHCLTYIYKATYINIKMRRRAGAHKAPGNSEGLGHGGAGARAWRCRGSGVALVAPGAQIWAVPAPREG